MHFRKLLSILLIGAVLPPVFICLLLGVGRLLTSMRDPVGALWLDRLALLLALVWCCNLIALLVCLAVDRLRQADSPLHDARSDD